MSEPLSVEQVLELAWEKKIAGDWPVAAFLYEECLLWEPDNFEALRELGLLIYGQKKDFVRAREMLERCLTIRDDPDAHYFLALVYEEVGWLDKAVVEFQTALGMYACQDGIGLKAVAHAHFGHLLYANHDLVRAKYHLETALQIDGTAEGAERWSQMLNEIRSREDSGASKSLPSSPS